jgi:hypothetical protein
MPHVYKTRPLSRPQLPGLSLHGHEILLANHLLFTIPTSEILRLRYAYNRSWRLASIMHESVGRKSPPLLHERCPSQPLDTPIPFNDGLTKLTRIAQKQLL